MKKIVIGSRNSPLAIIQSELLIANIKKNYPSLEVSLKDYGNKRG